MNRTKLSAALLAASGALVTTGVALWSAPAGFVAAGVALVAWTLAVVLEVRP